jgi:hypothetical protein
MATDIPSWPCAFFALSFLITENINSSVKTTFEMLLSVKGVKVGRTLPLARGLHWAAKKTLKILALFLKLGSYLPFSNSGGILVTFFLLARRL